MFWFYAIVFMICCAAFYFAGEQIINGLRRIAKFLGWKEFVTAFFIMAAAASLPNLFVGITSAAQGIPQLSFGDICGNNLACLTIAVALAAFFAKKGISSESRTVQATSIFTIISAILPLLLVFDGTLSRVDGFMLICFFIFYIVWLFSKKDRFAKIYDQGQRAALPLEGFKTFLKDLGKLAIAIAVFIFAAQGIVLCARFFASNFDLPLVFIGVVVVGFGSALPEIYFAVSSARKEETGMILGDLMGAVIIPATLVLGVVALIHPIYITDPSSLIIARIFMIIAALFFFIVLKTGKQITKKEGAVLLLVYVLFLTIEISRSYF